MRLYLLLLFFVIGGCSSKVPFKSYGSDISPRVKCILSSSKYSDERISLAEHHHLAVTERIEECQISLGRRYENGFGVEADYELARFYYSLSPSGFRYLASMAENGIGQTVDYLEAERLYRESVSAGVPCSPVNLAMFLERRKSSNVSEISSLYLDALYSCRGAWTALWRLYESGVPLSDVQILRYQGFWLEKWQASVGVRLRRSKYIQEEVGKLSDATVLKLGFSFKRGRQVPEISIVQSSGYEYIDNVFLGFFERSTYEGIILKDSDDAFSFTLPLLISSSQR